MPRFVVLEHDWNGIHYDLMLEPEGGGPLRTWALDRFPAIGPAIGARALPDHRPAYLDYEGPISGDRGRVRRVDRGDYVVVRWTPDRVRVRLEGATVRGIAELRRAGGAADPTDWTFRLGSES